MAGNWRIEILGWAQLSRAGRITFLKIVGHWQGEWWGEGRAEFPDANLAAGCLRELREQPALKQRPLLMQSGPSRDAPGPRS